MKEVHMYLLRKEVCKLLEEKESFIYKIKTDLDLLEIAKTTERIQYEKQNWGEGKDQRKESIR